MAAEHLDGLRRLYAVDYYGLDESLSSLIDAEPKRYFFDGSTGSYTEYNSENELLKAWIFPTMRRGGRQIYALNVSQSMCRGSTY